ncbi:hypothetical protein CDAR_224231 [Caerostris darwini]|uniref:Uncharacterized protein n=1 Tax=Caerostris darwini TaxID=1538125 RepID=A0AAV4WQD3_9ARAC|nr:hypothetical protein CDAR_224231 [Caerostris darwini]
MYAFTQKFSFQPGAFKFKAYIGYGLIGSFKKMPMLHCNNIHASVYIFCKEQVFNNLKILRRLAEGAVNVDEDFKKKSRIIEQAHLHWAGNDSKM